MQSKNTAIENDPYGRMASTDSQMMERTSHSQHEDANEMMVEAVATPAQPNRNHNDSRESDSNRDEKHEKNSTIKNAR